jgi:hypothetical protein
MRVATGIIAWVAASAIIIPAFAVESTPQPLTRADCEKAGMKWNDNANVCGAKEATTKPEAKSKKKQ